MPKFPTYPLVTTPAPTDLLLVKEGAATKGMPLSQVRNVGWFNVKDYASGVGGGTHDDTAAFNGTAAAAAASGADGAVVYMPPDFYRITGPVATPDPVGSGYYTGVSFRGDGSRCTTIKYEGPTTAGSAALKLFGQTGTRSGGFTLRNITGSHGAAAGLYFGGDNPAAGTVTNGLEYNDLVLDQWFIGALLGDPSSGIHSVSEILFSNLKLTNCDTGVLLAGAGNTITTTLVHLAAGGCPVVIDTGTGLNTNVFGASISGATKAAFYVRESTLTIHGLWLEASYFLTQRGASQVKASAINASSGNPASPPSGGYIMDIQGGKCFIEGSRLEGKIVMSNLAGAAGLRAVDTWFLRPDGTSLFENMGTSYPWGAFPSNPSGDPGFLNGVEYAFKGCVQAANFASTAHPIPNQEGRIHWDDATSKFWKYGGGQFKGSASLFQTLEDPVLADLSMGGGADGQAAQKIIGQYVKNGKLVYAYDNGGVLTFLSIPLNGSTATWTQSTTAP